MLRRTIILSGILFFSLGCNHRESSTAAHFETSPPGRPLVALVPVFDTTHHGLNWNVSKELSFAMRHSLNQRNQLYLVGEESFLPHAKKALGLHNPFSVETNWIKKAFPQNEFVVFLQLIQHEEVPITPELKNTAAELQLAVRVRVFDLRETTPKIVLQEIVEQSHHIPKQFTKAYFNQVPWGDETFDVSPLGVAHDQLSKELSSRIEDYILRASRDRS